MYYYIVDTSKITQRQFNKVQQTLYAAISENRINGEIVRVTGLRTAKQLVETAFFHQANTIVAVGTDETLEEIINLVGERPMIIGYIPLVRTELSEILGLENVAEACRNLSLRRVAEIDLGVVNEKLFLSKLIFGISLKRGKQDYLGISILKNFINKPAIEIKFDADGKYRGETNIIGGVVMNCTRSLGSPNDGLLDVVLLPNLSRMEIFRHRFHILTGEYNLIPRTSVIHVENLEITQPAQTTIYCGTQKLTNTPAQISIKPKALKLIVGRSRTFI